MMIRLPVFHKKQEQPDIQKTEKRPALPDAGMGLAFVTAIAALLLVAGYVISRLSSERAYREKWKDYNDCGWA